MCRHAVSTHSDTPFGTVSVAASPGRVLRSDWSAPSNQTPRLAPLTWTANLTPVSTPPGAVSAANVVACGIEVRKCKFCATIQPLLFASGSAVGARYDTVNLRRKKANLHLKTDLLPNVGLWPSQVIPTVRYRPVQFSEFTCCI